MSIAMDSCHLRNLQFFWWLLASGFNLVSMIRETFGYRLLIDSSPQVSLMLLMPFLILFILEKKQWHKAYSALAIFAGIALSIRGVYPHWAALGSMEGISIYSSTTSAITALVINTFGVATLLLTPFVLHAKAKHNSDNLKGFIQ